MTATLNAGHTAHRALDVIGPTAMRRILLATAGQANTAGALRIACELGTRHGAQVSVVTVYQPPVPLPLRPGEDPRVEPAHMEEIDVQRAVVQRQIAETAGNARNWPLELRVGEHGRCILEEAARLDADLILLGIGRANAGERPLGDRALLRVAYGADRPLMAVCPALDHLPRVVVLAIGQNGEAARLAQLVSVVADEGAMVHLVHVHEPGEPEETMRHRNAILSHVESELQRRGLATTRQEIRRGDPMRRLLAYARRVGAELVAGGLHGEGFAARTVVRNIALHMAAISRCSVLLVPRSEP